MNANKRGTAMVEASLIIPIIITVIMTLIYIIMGLYNLVQENIDFHASLLENCDENSNVGDFIRKIDFLKGQL